METPASPSDDPRAERRLELLAELADLGMDLARGAAALARKHLVEAVDGWAPRDAEPTAPFVKLAQCVRRTFALEVHLRNRGGAGMFAESGKAARYPAGAPAGRDIETAADRDPPERFERPERAETLARDLGPLLEPREGLIDTPMGAPDDLIAGLRRDLGQEPGNRAVAAAAGPAEPPRFAPGAARPANGDRRVALSGARLE